MLLPTPEHCPVPYFFDSLKIIQTQITSLSLSDRDAQDPQSDLHAEIPAGEQLDRPALFLSTA